MHRRSKCSTCLNERQNFERKIISVSETSVVFLKQASDHASILLKVFWHCHAAFREKQKLYRMTGKAHIILLIFHLYSAQFPHLFIYLVSFIPLDLAAITVPTIPFHIIMSLNLQFSFPGMFPTLVFTQLLIHSSHIIQRISRII